jgi:hypothetical protein
MISTDQNPFTPDNNYAFIECIDKATGNVLFKKPCTALTKIEISEDENYIVGISNIMLWNPYQLVVFSIQGELIKKRHISFLEAKLDSTQTIDFKKKYPKMYSLLKADNRIYKTDNFYYIDFLSMNMPKKLGKAWHYLFNYSSSNHLSANFSETVTNWVYWYFESNPDIKINYQDEKLYSISLLDPKQERIEIKIIE